MDTLAHSDIKEEEQPKKAMHLDDSEDAVLFGKEILDEAQQYHENLQAFRDNYQRNKKFIFGEQWEDEMDDPDNAGAATITEKDYILRQSKNPFVVNYLGPLVKNLKGQYRNQDSKSAVRARKKEDQLAADMLTNALQSSYDSLELQELDAAQFFQSLLSSSICWKSYYTWNKNRNVEDVYCKNISANRLIFNTDTTDPRGDDIRLIGEIIDAPMDSVLSTYANDDEEREIIKEWYSECDKKFRNHDMDQLGADSMREDFLDFYTPYHSGHCRVFEIWKLVNMKKVFVHDPEDGEIFQVPGTDVEMAEAEIQAENAVRELEQRPVMTYEIKYEDVWCYYYLTPLGKVLDSGETPYEHEGTPYTLRIPTIDGRFRAFLDDVIDMQKMVNRQVILQDWLVSASSKGTLMVPEDVKPDGWSWDDFEGQYSKVGGMIVFKVPKHGVMPFEITSQARSAGSEQLLQFAMTSMKEISGITEAIQGQTPKSGTPASLYQEQANNATLATKDFFDYFAAARKNRDYKLVKLQQQYYDEERYVALSGQEYVEEAAMYDPSIAGDVQVDMIIAPSSNAPVYREIKENYLMEFLKGQMIDLETYLKNSSVNWNPSFLKSVTEQKQQMMQQMGGGQQQLSDQDQAQVLEMLPQA